MPKKRFLINTHQADRSFNDIGDDRADNYTSHLVGHARLGNENIEKDMHRKNTDKRAKEESKKNAEESEAT